MKLTSSEDETERHTRNRILFAGIYYLESLVEKHTSAPSVHAARKMLPMFSSSFSIFFTLNLNSSTRFFSCCKKVSFVTWSWSWSCLLQLQFQGNFASTSSSSVVFPRTFTTQYLCCIEQCRQCGTLPTTTTTFSAIVGNWKVILRQIFVFNFPTTSELHIFFFPFPFPFFSSNTKQK